MEDHWAEGGLGEAVLAGLADEDVQATVTVLAMRQMPGSGTPAELLSAAGIDAASVAEAARQLMKTGGMPA